MFPFKVAISYSDYYLVVQVGYTQAPKQMQKHAISRLLLHAIVKSPNVLCCIELNRPRRQCHMHSSPLNNFTGNTRLPYRF